MFALTHKKGAMNPWNDFFGLTGRNQVRDLFEDLENQVTAYRANTAVKEDENAYHITAELPGIDKKDVKVEMDKNILNKYIEVINKIIKPNYIYHENSNFLMFPKSKRHIEILGKDFKFNKKKYRLENFNISPFSGGSGRYREFFYKKI